MPMRAMTVVVAVKSVALVWGGADEWSRAWAEGGGGTRAGTFCGLPTSSFRVVKTESTLTTLYEKRYLVF